MADVVAAVPHRATTAVRTTPFAVLDVPAAGSSGGGATAIRDTPVAVSRAPAARRAHGGATPVPAALVAAAAAFIGVSAQVSTALAYFAALAVSLVAVTRAAWPEEVDGDLGRLDARLRRWARAAACSARADLAADLRRLRCAARRDVVLAPVCDGAEEIARVAGAAVADGFVASRTWAEAAWSEHGGAARAAWFLLRLVPRAIYWLGAGLIEEAYDGAVVRAPAVLSCLRGVVGEIRTKKSVDAAVSSASGISHMDMSYLIKTAGYVVICADMTVYVHAFFGLSFRYWVPCFLVTCFTALIVAEWVCCLLEEEDSIEPTRAAEVNKVPESWRHLWFLMITSHIVDASLLRLALGPRPVAVAFLAFCNVKVINVGKKVQRAPDGDGEASAGGAGKWRRVAMAVLAASSVKVFAIYVLLGFQPAALSLASLGVTTVLLLIREENLSDLEEASGHNDSGRKAVREEGAGFARNDIVGGAGEETEVRAEHSNTSVDDAEAHDDGSAEAEEHVEEQRHEEPDCSSNNMDDWDVVEMDDLDSPIVADQS